MDASIIDELLIRKCSDGQLTNQVESCMPFIVWEPKNRWAFGGPLLHRNGTDRLGGRLALCAAGIKHTHTHTPCTNIYIYIQRICMYVCMHACM